MNRHLQVPTTKLSKRPKHYTNPSPYSTGTRGSPVFVIVTPVRLAVQLLLLAAQLH